MEWLEAFRNIRMFGLEYVFRRFPGLYDGTVTDVRDPQKRGRVRCLVPSIGAREPSQEWFRPAQMGAGSNRGFFMPPSIGDTVLVCFENGDPSRPKNYIGGWYGVQSGVSEVPTELGYDTGNPPAPKRIGFVTRMGHALIFNETAGEEQVILRWRQSPEGDAARSNLSATASRTGGKTSTLTMDAEGGVDLRSSTGARVTMAGSGDVTVTDARGNTVSLRDGILHIEGDTVTIQADRVTVDAGQVDVGSAASNHAVLAEPLLSWLNTHTHPTGTGPSGPPTAPCPSSIGSRSVTLKP